MTGRSSPQLPPFLLPIAGDVTTPLGFTACGVACGLKAQGRRDLALIASDRPASAAGLFTTNRVQAAPVRYCRALLASGEARVVVANSGNANACTGPRGEADTREMADLVAGGLGLEPDSVLVASTGVIGVPLPMERIRDGLVAAAKQLGTQRDGGARAAEAIMTTDTVPKACAVEVELVQGRGRVRVGGIAKGAGMIRPDLATTLGFVTTDAAVESALLHRLLVAATERSFNRISVDGDMSTNDCLLLLAGGASGLAVESGEDADRLLAGLTYVLTELAKSVVRDGEGATKLVEVRIEGAADDADAELAAFAVADSLLVKTALHGAEPNWGRILPAIGWSGAAMEEAKTAVWFNELQLVREGVGLEVDAEAAAAELRGEEVLLRVDLGLGEGTCTVWTCDLSAEYVRINGSYIS